MRGVFERRGCGKPKTVEHNAAYLNRVLELLHANGYDTMA